MDAADLIDRDDVGVIERGSGARLLFETREPVAIRSECLRQQLDRHLATEPRVARFPDLSHPARAARGENLVRTNPRTGGHRHSRITGAAAPLPSAPPPRRGVR